MYRLLILVFLALMTACDFSGRNEQAASATRLADAMAESDPRYLRADQPRIFEFPLDHGPHPGYKTEWWYLTGNLLTANQRRFGYQFTLFRIALSPVAHQRTSTWAADDIYMAHFALTDLESKRFYHFERFARGAAGLAGAEAMPFKVWLEDWQLSSVEGEFFPLRLAVTQGELALDLALASAKPVVLQGDKGWSQKSAEPGNASYYYSYTRMPTQGRIRIDAQQFDVSGNSWLDREWSTSALGKGQQGWDWFALQLSDGRELMFYQLRLQDGSADTFSKGVLVSVDGVSTLLMSEDVKLTVLGLWQSEATGVSYPLHWQISIPKHDLQLTVKAVIPHQEMQLTVRYWEGAVDVEGSADHQPINGQGYLELAGYE